ncbi:MAG: DUF6345 domain-containing protein [Methanotrichaceae archaeon]|nr:DUF6345 domain-containing protein [Methanotrichaceae archaeon]
MDYAFSVCNGFYEKLIEAGHTCAFYYANDDCWERDLRSATLGGEDTNYGDTVDLFFMNTHGGIDNSGNHYLHYNNPVDNFHGNLTNMRLGDDYNLEWLLIKACSLVDLNNVGAVWDMFQRLHIFCGSWDKMWSGPTTDEVGEDVAQNLIDGEPVYNAWIDGVSDWWEDNHPIVIAAERSETWDGINEPDWANTTLFRDHLLGHGETVEDIWPDQKAWLSYIYAEG